MSDQSETARQKPIDPPQSWLRPNWDFAFALHQPNARKQAMATATRDTCLGSQCADYGRCFV
ncbi:MAG: hypothetical protein EBX72_03250, partial [Betaproteobacteria bacterium]|nr:hypothetical protein [Betaproteobacteria bacterium]